MFAQVIIKQNLVNEACQSRPFIFRQRFREGDIKLEIRESLFNCPEFIFIKNLSQRSSSIPVRDFTASLQNK
jgi:hypothetical protein